MEIKIFRHDLAKSTEELKRLIREHPDYPIVVLAGECANSGDYSWMYCDCVEFKIEEILDCEAPFDTDHVQYDKSDFEERLQEWLWEELKDENPQTTLSEAEIQKEFLALKARFERHWKKVIAIYVNNY